MKESLSNYLSRYNVKLSVLGVLFVIIINVANEFLMRHGSTLPEFIDDAFDRAKESVKNKRAFR